MAGFGFARDIDLASNDILKKIPLILEKYRFRILSQVDVGDVTEAPDVPRGAYTLFQVCHPTLSRQVLQQRPEFGPLLVNTIAIYGKEHGKSSIYVDDPIQLFNTAHEATLRPIADELNRLLWSIYLEIALLPHTHSYPQLTAV